MTEATMSAPLMQAWKARDHSALWQAYKNEWSSSISPPMAPGVFNFLFCDYRILKEASELSHQSPHAKETMRNGATQWPEELDLNSCSVDSLLYSLLSPDDMVDLWNRARELLSFADQRCAWAGTAVGWLVRKAGRAWARQRLSSWWEDRDLLEEEREAILLGLNEGGVLTKDLIRQLGPEAEALARRLAVQGHLSPNPFEGPISVPVFRDAPPLVADRFAALLELMGIGTDLRDSVLKSSELEKLGNSSENFSSSSSFLELYQHLPLTLHLELKRILALNRKRFFDTDGKLSFLVPLIRLLHMRLILEAPVLKSALERPEGSLVPEVLLFVLGRDTVAYVPELRIQGGADRRWRAKWAEITGEALSALFLEEALDLDLTTLSRIPEADRETPDFRAATLGAEPIVFESKGSTAFSTHKKQRIKALRQLGKLNADANSWAEPGRAFACCLFAAQHGEDVASLFYVADPPFAFRDLFLEGWETESRRRHYAGLAEAAGLFELADSVLRGVRSPEERAGEPQTFSLALERTKEGARFIGTYTSLSEEARRLRHPRPEMFERIRMFTGLRADLVWDLQNGRIPVPVRRQDPQSSEEAPLIPSSGVLPDRESAGNGRGVFSYLPDGAFLAFEVT